MNRKLILAITALAILGTIVGIIVFKSISITAQEETSTNTSHPARHEPAIPTTTPTATGNGINVAYPDADQAPLSPNTTPTHPTQDITQPTPNENLDRTNPEAVAHEVLTLYTSRAKANDTTYQTQIKDLITDDLAQEIFSTTLPFTDSYPLAATTITLGDNIKEWGIDTPARYSHYATATIATTNHGIYNLDIRIAALNTPNGWTITDLAIDSWSMTHDD